MSQGEPNRYDANLSDLAQLGDDDIPLAETALRIARAEYPNLDVRRWIAEIDRLAARARALAAGAGATERLAGLDRAFFDEAGLLRA